MPHAALFVVQQYSSILRLIEVARFNAARGFVGGAAIYNAYIHHEFESVSMPHAALWVVQPPSVAALMRKCSRFNAARGFVGGAASSLATLVPLGRKSPFGKSPEI